MTESSRASEHDVSEYEVFQFMEFVELAVTDIPGHGPAVRMQVLSLCSIKLTAAQFGWYFELLIYIIFVFVIVDDSGFCRFIVLVI